LGTVDLRGPGGCTSPKTEVGREFLSVQRDGGQWSSGRAIVSRCGLHGIGALGAHFPCLF
jgi:hypothetical protein